MSRDEYVVALDYGQFSLRTGRDTPDLYMPALETAMNGDGIAQLEDWLVVVSPHQNNFAMSLTVEVWDGPPPADLDEWQEAFTAYLTVEDAGLLFESPTLETTALQVPRGSYQALLTGRGFVTIGWPGSTEPGDVWRLQLWPGPPIGPSRLRRFSPPPVGQPPSVT